MAVRKEKLFSEFQAPSKQEWVDKINVDLKGADFEKKMVWRTNEGFNMQPFYQREDVKDLASVNSLPGQFPYVRGNKKDNNVWFVRQNISVECPKSANEKALDVLNKGVDSLGFCIPAETVSKGNIETLLDGICPQAVELNFNTCLSKAVELARILTEVYTAKGCDLKECQGSINFDPIQKILKTGKDASALVATGKELIEVLAQLPKYRCLTVNSLELVNAGAYCYQELGYALSWGNEYLQQMVDAGVPADVAAKKIKFNMGVGGNYFMEIAKFRAGRMLWAKVVEAYAPQCQHKDVCKNVREDGICQCACKMNVCATTTMYNQTVFDSYVNLLRSQTESMSAALANVDSIVVTPFDKSYQTPNDFSERLARNQQLLLKEEAHFDKIVDAAGGSYFIETLTEALAQQAWKLFLETEEAGGMLKCALDSKIQDAVNATNVTRHGNAAKRKEFILGTNQFPNFTEKSEGKTPKSMSCACQCKCGEETGITALKYDRLASEFENLRLKTEGAEKQPVAFMLTIGNLAMRQARAQFSCNFLAAAGYKVVDNLGFETVEAGVEAAVNAGADIVVLCSSDDEYAEYAVPAFQALNGRAMYIVAGAPACMEDLKAAGIENFIHVRSNQLETLKEYNVKLGI
ncbi:MAG: methylmalonyl-CoA mutase family protein [Bacteroidaceae bacterium]|nr:methylmalonyl-CoA mutase family protein [Bacteroidaceae bacterium]